MFCKHCGAQIDDGAKFCTSCGTALEVNDAPAPQVTFDKPVQYAAPAAQPVAPAQYGTPNAQNQYSAPMGQPVAPAQYGAVNAQPVAQNQYGAPAAQAPAYYGNTQAQAPAYGAQSAYNAQGAATAKSSSANKIILIIIAAVVVVIVGIFAAFAIMDGGKTFDQRVELAQEYIQDGNYNAAISELEKAHRMKPDDYWVTSNLGDLYIRVGNTNKAAELAKEIYGDIADALTW